MFSQTFDELRIELAQQGWLVEETACLDDQWIVCGSKGKEALLTRDRDRTEAWRKAAEQARVVGKVKLRWN